MHGAYKDTQPELKCPFVDPEQAFIPILTNHLKSISGWQDILVPIHTSKEGAYKEEHSMVDGIVTNYTAYDIEATFRNSKGDAIMLLFYVWEQYMAAVAEGTLMPYPDFIVENAIDYNTRMYRLVLDPSKTKVQKIAANGVALPTSLPVGAYFDFSVDKPYNDANSDITIRFKCLGAQYFDDILIDEFNKTVQIFNPAMRQESLNREKMVKIPLEMLNIFNNRGYPRIDPDTYELSWWVSALAFQNKQAAIAAFKNSF
jgi:hypothetical protein